MKFSIFFMISATLLSANFALGLSVLRDVPALGGEPKRGQDVQQFGGLISNIVARVLDIGGVEAEKKKNDDGKPNVGETHKKPKKQGDNANEVGQGADIEKVFEQAQRQFEQTMDGIAKCFEKWLEGLELDLDIDDDDVDEEDDKHKEEGAAASAAGEKETVNDKDVVAPNAGGAGNVASAEKPKPLPAKAQPVGAVDAKPEVAANVVKETAENVNKIAATDKETAPAASATPVVPAPAPVAEKVAEK